MGQSSFLKGILRHKLAILFILSFSFVALATVIPDNTTIIGDLTVQTTNGIDVNPGSDVDTDLISIGVTGSPKIKWNETQDAIQFIEKLILGTNAILTKTVNGSAYTSKMSLDTDTTTDSGGIDVTRHGSSDASYGSISLLRSRGTHASQSIVQSGDLISSIVGLGYDGVDYEPVASIEMYSDGTPGSNDMPGRIDFKTVSDGSRVLNQVMRLGSSANVMIGTTTSEASSILEVQSVTKGSRPSPRMSQTQRDAILSPATGLTVYNNDFNTYDLYNGASWENLATNSNTLTLSGKTLTSPLINTPTIDVATLDGQGSTPANPSSGFYKAYVKDSTGKLTILNSAGTETAVGGGSSGINLIGDGSDAEAGTTGWSTFADAASSRPVDGTGGSANVTWTTSSSSPLYGDNSFVFTKDAVNRQGEGVSYGFTVSPAHQAKVLQISFDYIVGSGTFVAGSSTTDSDLIAYIYDVTNSQLIEPSSFKLLSNSSTIADKFNATFQTSATGTSYRLILYCASTSASAYTLKFDNISVSPSTFTSGFAGDDFTNVTAVAGDFTGFGTPTSMEIESRRVGDSLEIRGKFVSGTATATEGRVALRYKGGTVTAAGTDKIASIKIVGKAVRSSVAAVDFVVLAAPNTNYVTFGIQDGSRGGSGSQNGDQLIASGATFTFFASVPILGWSSSVQMSDQTDTRVVAARYTTNAGQSISNATNTIIDFEDKDFDTNGAVTTGASWKFTAQTPGIYSASATITSTSTGNFTGTEYVELKLFKNGSFYSSKYVSNFTGSSVQIGVTHSDEINLVAGDSIDFRVYQTSGATVPLDTAVGYNFCLIKRLSGPSAIAASETVSMLASTAATSISTSTETVVNGTVMFDSHGAYNSTTGVYTAPISGKYRITTSIRFPSTAIGSGGVQELYVQKNSETNIPIARSNWSSVTVTIMLNGSYTFNLLAGDTLKVKAYNNTTSSLTGENSNFVEIERIGN